MHIPASFLPEIALQTYIMLKAEKRVFRQVGRKLLFFFSGAEMAGNAGGLYHRHYSLKTNTLQRLDFYQKQHRKKYRTFWGKISYISAGDVLCFWRRCRTFLGGLIYA